MNHYQEVIDECTRLILLLSIPETAGADPRDLYAPDGYQWTYMSSGPDTTKFEQLHVFPCRFTR